MEKHANSTASRSMANKRSKTEPYCWESWRIRAETREVYSKDLSVDEVDDALEVVKWVEDNVRSLEEEEEALVDLSVAEAASEIGAGDCVVPGVCVPGVELIVCCGDESNWRRIGEMVAELPEEASGEKAPSFEEDLRDEAVDAMPPNDPWTGRGVDSREKLRS